MNAPQLVLGRNAAGQECWQLYAYEGSLSVCLEIRYYYGDDEGPSHYNLMYANEDEPGRGYLQLISQQELNDRYETVKTWEGRKEADEWLRQQVPKRFYVAGKYHKAWRIAEELKAQWEKLLELVNPSVNL